MALTQNYYNWIKAVKFGLGTSGYGQWTNMPNTFKCKDSSGSMVTPSGRPNVNYIDYRTGAPFESILGWTGSGPYRNNCYIIPSNNTDDENINDYVVSQTWAYNNFAGVGTGDYIGMVQRIADWENDSATVKAKYMNKTSAAVTVSGLELIGYEYQLYEKSTASILFYRKKFDTPITVQPGEIIELSLSWEVA